MLVAALANFALLATFITIEQIQNRDATEYLATIYDTRPSLWAWIGLAPAMISGHFAAKAAQQGVWLLFQAVGSVFLFWVAGIGSIVLHLYTTYGAYQTSGVLAALLTLAMPLLSELYWFLAIWHTTEVFFNLYTLRLLALGCLYLIGAVLLGIGLKLENSAKEQNKLRDHTVPP
jgi:hypothetical protein